MGQARDPERRPQWRQRTRASLGRRAQRVRLDGIFAAQSGVAAGLSWFVAADLLRHEQPIFAPISAIVVLSAATTQRWRRAWELVFGVALGIAVGDVLVLLIGVGSVQIGAVVALAIVTAGFLGGGNIAVGQAASSGVLVATIAPPTSGIYYTRFVDALVGGVVGLLVMNLLPFNPLTRVRRAAGKALAQLAESLQLAAAALTESDERLAEEALELLRSTDEDHVNLRDSIIMGRETATLAPLRWSARAALALYTDAAVHIDRATRNVRVLQRRISSTLRDGEPVPPDLHVGLSALGDAVSVLRRELADARDPGQARELILDAVRATAAAYSVGVGFSGSVVVAQVRSAAVDLLCATGLPHREASRVVRRAVRLRTDG